MRATLITSTLLSGQREHPASTLYVNFAKTDPTYAHAGVILVRAVNAEFGEFAELPLVFRIWTQWVQIIQNLDGVDKPVGMPKCELKFRNGAHARGRDRQMSRRRDISTP